MQTRITRYVIVGLMAVTLMGVGLIKETQAQWAPAASPYYVGPSYVAWRPFGGLFVGLRNDLHNLLCHRCWCSPCRCVMPMYYDPCPTPCFDPCCDPCCNSCCDSCGTTFSGFVGDSCGCSTRFSYFSSTSQSGIPSPTGFGSVTPVDGVPAQRSVGTPAAQRPILPTTGRQTIRTPDNTFQQQPTDGPTKAPEQNFAPIQLEDIDSRLDNIGRSGRFNDAANIAPTTDFGGSSTTSGAGTTGSYGDRPAETGVVPETAPTGGLPLPAGMSLPGANEPQNRGGGSSNNMMNLGSGAISITVPEHSKVFINGYETKMTGVNRRYVVNDLVPGQSYQYEIYIIADIAGQLVEETQLVTLSGGQQSMIAFSKGQQQFVGESNAYLAARPAR